MKIALTGHRPHKLGNEYSCFGPVSDKIKIKLQDFIDNHKTEITTGISGMALGADTIWALSCLHNEIPLIAAIPFEGQELKWPKDRQVVYHSILGYDIVTIKYVCDPGYAPWKMQKRNEWMVDNCDLLIAVWDGSEGGTSNCIKYASKKGRKIHYINPKDF